MKKILVILAHPRKTSYCAALTDAYIKGARKGGAKVTYVKLSDLTFDALSLDKRELESDLKLMQTRIHHADHLVIVYPTWWGNIPALLKGFFDRVLTSGFAFKYRRNGFGWHKFLKGRSARLITTTGGPWLLNHIVYRAAGIRALKWATLWFVGIWPVRVTEFSNLNTRWSSEHKRKQYLKKVERLGEKDAG